jgi:hypothetical protein
VRRVAWLVGTLIALACPGRARADLKEWTVAVAPTYAITYADQRTAHGGGFALDLGFGLTDALSLHASGNLSWQSADATKTQVSGVLAGFTALLGLNYTIDVIRLVPSFDVSLGVVGLRGDASFGSTARADSVEKPLTALCLALGFQFDYLITKHVAVGIEVRYHVALTDLDRLPMYLYTGPRVVFHFGG